MMMAGEPVAGPFSVRLLAARLGRSEARVYVPAARLIVVATDGVALAAVRALVRPAVVVTVWAERTLVVSSSTSAGRKWEMHNVRRNRVATSKMRARKNRSLGAPPPPPEEPPELLEEELDELDELLDELLLELEDEELLEEELPEDEELEEAEYSSAPIS